MTRLFNHTAGFKNPHAGALSRPDDAARSHIHLSVLEYSPTDCTRKEDLSLDECLEHLDTPSMTWIQVSGISDPDVVAAIGEHFKLHSLVIEDILSRSQRSKLDVYGEQVFIVVRYLRYDDASGALKDEQISIVFGSNYLICFSEDTEDIFAPVKLRLTQGSNRIRKEGADYLAYALLDLVVDYYFVVLEKVDVALDLLEEELIHSPRLNTLQQIQKAKKEMIVLRKAVWPTRDVVSRFSRLEAPFVTPTTQVYLRDIYDHTIQTIDIIEGFRDVVAGMMDIYLSGINIRTNEIMRVLTIVSTIFVPLTFISSLYGMNFDYMPELRYHFAYFAVLSVMVAIALFMLVFFYRKKWI